MKIGVFGGTFDPIHFGHIHCALSLLEAHGLDHVFFIPAHTNPHKMHKDSAPAEMRLKMVQKALRNIPGCSCLSIGVTHSGPTYMIDTLRFLRAQKKYEKTSFFLLLGEDLLCDLHRWKDYEEVLTVAPPLVAMRNLLQSEKWKENPYIYNRVMEQKIVTPYFDISATEIRQRIRKGLYCGHLIPQVVLRYIEKQELYI